MEKQQKQNLKLIIIVIGFVILGSLLYYGFEIVAEDNYQRGIQEGQASLVFQIKVTGSVPILDERLPNVFQWKWFPMGEICNRMLQQQNANN